MDIVLTGTGSPLPVANQPCGGGGVGNCVVPAHSAFRYSSMSPSHRVDLLIRSVGLTVTALGLRVSKICLRRLGYVCRPSRAGIVITLGCCADAPRRGRIFILRCLRARPTVPGSTSNRVARVDQDPPATCGATASSSWSSVRTGRRDCFTPSRLRQSSMVVRCMSRSRAGPADSGTGQVRLGDIVGRGEGEAPVSLGGW